LRDNSSLAEGLVALVASDVCGRYLPRLCSPLFLDKAAALLAVSKRPVIVTGFYVPSVQAPETDGPPGAAVLARALSLAGKDLVVVTDRWNDAAVAACCRVMGLEGPVVAKEPEEIMALDPDLLVFIERLGHAGDGRYYNMRGEDISEWTPPLDGAAVMAMERGVPVIAVGDGGNEAGMACLAPEKDDSLACFRECLSSVGATVALPVDVSNWGGYALACMLSVMEGRWLGHSPEEERAMVAAMVEAGAVDGVSGRKELSVDGLEISEHMEVVGKLRNIFDAIVKKENHKN